MLSVKRTWRTLFVFLMVAALTPSGLALANFDAKSVIINPNPPYQTTIWTDRAQYNPGDRLSINFRTNKDAYIYIFDIDTVGNVSLIFPNIYSDSNYRRANQTYVLPDNSRYNLTVGGPSGTEQLVLIATPSRIDDVDWVRRSLQQGAFSPQLNMSMTADKFMFEVKSVNITPNFGQNWSSAVATFTVGWGSPTPVPTPPPPPPPPPPPQAWGVLSISSTPSGARVYLDGVDRGTTPLTITGVSYGAHEISIVKKDYYAYSRQVTVNSPSTQQIRAQLTKMPSSHNGQQGQWPGQEIQLLAKTVNVKWPATGPFTDTFSFAGNTGNVVISGDPVLGMMSRVTAAMTVNSMGPVQFGEISPTGVDAPWPGRVFERVQYPFKARVTVEDYSVVTGPVFAIQYLDQVRLRVEVWYVGN